MKDSPRSTTWLWIAIPFVVVLAAVAIYIWRTDPQAVSPFTYGQ